MAEKKRIRTKDVEKLASLGCTEREAAAFFEIRKTTFSSLLARDKRVANAWERGQQLGKISLRRKQSRLAGVNARMAIFLGKNILGQHEVITNRVTGESESSFDASKLTQKERDEIRRLITRGQRESSED
jgi:hypothetical protein